MRKEAILFEIGSSTEHYPNSGCGISKLLAGIPEMAAVDVVTLNHCWFPLTDDHNPFVLLK